MKRTLAILCIILGLQACARDIGDVNPSPIAPNNSGPGSAFASGASPTYVDNDTSQDTAGGTDTGGTGGEDTVKGEDAGCTGTESYCTCLPANYNNAKYCTCKESPLHKSDIYCECCNFAFDDTNPDYDSTWKGYQSSCENLETTPTSGCE